MPKQFSLAKAFRDLLTNGRLGGVELDHHVKTEAHSNWRYISSPDTRAILNGNYEGPGAPSALRFSFHVGFEKLGLQALQQRDLSASDVTAGSPGNAGLTIGQEFTQLDPSLQPGSVLPLCSWATGLRGNLPVTEADIAPVSWGTELSTISEADQTFTLLLLAPKLVSGQTKISRQLLAQGVPGLDDYLRRELTRALVSGLNQAVLVGSGASGQPTGISATTGVNTVTLVPNWSQVVQAEIEAVTANITDFSNFAYALNAATLSTFKTTAKGANMFGQLTDVGAFGSRTNGFATIGTSALGTVKMVAGDFSRVLIGVWGDGVQITVDQVTQAGAGMVVLTLTLYADLVVRYPEVFTVGN